MHAAFSDSDLGGTGSISRIIRDTITIYGFSPANTYTGNFMGVVMVMPTGLLP